MLEEQATHITQLIQHAKAQEARSLEPSAESEAEWCAVIKQKALNNRSFQESCTPGYYNNEGHVEDGGGFIGSAYGGGPIEFFDIVRKWREEERMRGLLLR
jgi:hypothetical protein